MFIRYKLGRSITIVSALVMTYLPAAAAQDALRGWQVKAKTGAIILISVEESATRTAFSLKNVSGTIITAFAVSFDSGRDLSSHYREYFGAERARDRCCLPARGRSPGGFRSPDHTLQIEAVIFEDASSEGSQAHIDSITYTRLGQMFETERIKGILAAPVAQFEGEAGTKALTEKVGKLPESPEAAFASLESVILPGVSVDKIRSGQPGALFGFLAGVRHAREDLLREVDRLRVLPRSASDPDVLTQVSFVSGLRHTYETRSAKNHAFCKRTGGGLNK